MPAAPTAYAYRTLTLAEEVTTLMPYAWNGMCVPAQPVPHSYSPLCPFCPAPDSLSLLPDHEHSPDASFLVPLGVTGLAVKCFCLRPCPCYPYPKCHYLPLPPRPMARPLLHRA